MSHPPWWLLALASVVLACAPARNDVITIEVSHRSFRQRVTAEGILKSARVTKVGVPEEVEVVVRLAWLRPEGAVEDGEVVARFDATDFEDLLVEGRRDLESADLKVRKTESEIDSKTVGHETAYTVADLELDHARRFQKTDEGIYARREIVEDEIDETLAGDRKRVAAALRDTQKSLGQTELDLLAIERRRASLKIGKAETGLEALEVRAPHAGLMTWARDRRGEPPQVGAQMWRGQSIAEFPDLSVMEAEVFVLEADAGGLEVGKPAEVMLEARPDTVFSAVISKVGAIAQPRFRGSPVQYFTVTLEFENQDELPPRPGQRVKATLLLEDLDSALVVPRQAVFVIEGESYVFVRNGFDFVQRPVELGASSPALMVVTAGLENGDVIALGRPLELSDDDQKESSP